MRKSHHSLHGLLRQSLLRSVVCMILPVCVLAGLLVVLTQRYGADIALTTRASEVRTVLVQDLPDEVWNVVSGRISFEDGRQRMLIDSALHELNDMLDSAGEDEAQYLNAALRAIRTIDSYVDQLETQMDAGAAVSRNESLYREIHSVGHLAGSMLDRYIENEIARMGRFNARIQHGLGAAALALIALVGVMIWLTIRASDNLEGAIGASLRQLEQFANRIAAGELTERVPPTEIDELHLLTRDLNTMAEQLGALIHERVEQEKTIKKAELRALQAQINPHFLYNTLDALYWRATNEGNDEIAEDILSLSQLFRHVLGQGNAQTDIGNEKELLEEYLHIQKMRFSDHLDYEIHMEEAILSHMIPKLILQPFVENAVVHGFERDGGDCLIRVDGKREGEWIVFTVEDNGVGMSEEQLQDIWEVPDAKRYAGQRIGRYAIRNVKERLELLYGDGCTLRIESAVGRGTCVTIRIPWE